MNPPSSLFIILTAALVPALAFAAKDGKTRKRPSAEATPPVSEAVKSFDKNGNRLIDSDELAAMQKAFAELKKLDRNGNGEIEASEVAPPKPAASPDRVARAMEGLKKVDKNGNGKIDGDEIEGLQKAMAGGRIMQRLDQNGDGKLEAKQVARLNERLAQGGFSRRGSASKPTPAPSTSKPEAKPEAPKKEEAEPDAKGDLSKDPFLPTPDAKPPGDFGKP
jgi:Ca2+-binding EF-hand superfamily protein